ncbi:TonB C-terminal domain-containing protein [Sphingomonas sp. CJ20]
MLSKAESGGLAIAAIGHVVLFGLLSISFLTPPDTGKQRPQAIEISLAEDVALESAAPVPSSEAEATKKSPVEAPVEPDSAPPEPVVVPDPAPKPQPAPAKPQPAPPRPAPPKPAPAPAAKPKPAPPQPKPATAAAKPAPAQPAKPAASAAASNRPATRRPVKPTGNLDKLDLGRSSAKTDSKSTTPPAATVGPQVRSALQAEVQRQVKAHWSPPSGADTDQLRTTVQVQLGRDGSIIGEPRVSQTGVNASNRAQAAVHRERAIRAVKLAAPFKLPPQFYDAWKTIAPTLYEGL